MRPFISDALRTRAVILILLPVVVSLVSARNSRAQDLPLLWEEMFLFNIDPLQYGAGGWGDFDGDGDFDLIYTGSTEDFDEAIPFTEMYINMGETFRELPDASGEPILVSGIDYIPVPFVDLFDIPVWRSAVAWGDVNSDGRLDVVFTGLTRTGSRVLQIFVQLPPGAQRPFSRISTLPGLSDGDLVLADIDNDGDQDIIISGYDDNEIPRTEIYENRLSTEEGFVPFAHNVVHLAQSKIAVGDYDNDMDLDLIITGIGDPQEFITRLYRNDGNGNFSQTSDIFPSLLGADLAWGDYDADGDLDLLYTGGLITPFLLEGKVYVYENVNGSLRKDGVTIIAEFENSKAFGRYRGSAGWGDYNNDGRLDFLVAGGKSPQQTPMGRVYENRLSNNFSHTTVGRSNGRFPGGLFGTSSWGDFDNDGDLDIFSLGFDEARGNVAVALRNFLALYPRNRAPEAPGQSALVSTDGDQLTLSWTAGSDSATPTPGLTYNIRIGTTEGGSEIMSAMATPSGSRMVAANGNAQHNLSWKLSGLAPGTYYWAVQAIDTSFKGSPFSVERSFTIPQ